MSDFTGCLRHITTYLTCGKLIAYESLAEHHSLQPAETFLKSKGIWIGCELALVLMHIAHTSLMTSVKRITNGSLSHRTSISKTVRQTVPEIWKRACERAHYIYPPMSYVALLIGRQLYTKLQHDASSPRRSRDMKRDARVRTWRKL